MNSFSDQILYEDNHLIAINKHAGQIVHGDKTGDQSLVDVVKLYLKTTYNKPGNVYCGVIHRLDRPVSGVVVFAKTDKALTRMNQAIKDHKITKTYRAIVANCPPNLSDTLQHYLAKNEKQNKSYVVSDKHPSALLAQLEYKVLGNSERFSLIEVSLITGRHHQIRVQLSHIGSPIKGDLKYGARRSNPNGGISLHAHAIAFEHPVSKADIRIVAPTPKEEKLWNVFGM